MFCFESQCTDVVFKALCWETNDYFIAPHNSFSYPPITLLKSFIYCHKRLFLNKSKGKSRDMQYSSQICFARKVNLLLLYFNVFYVHFEDNPVCLPGPLYARLPDDVSACQRSICLSTEPSVYFLYRHKFFSITHASVKSNLAEATQAQRGPWAATSLPNISILL